MRHQSGLAEPTLEVAIEPFRIGLELLRQFDFTQQCSHWEVDYNLLSIGSSEAPESFRRAWDAWALLPLLAKSMLTILERPDLELAPKTTGLDQVREMVRVTQECSSTHAYPYESSVTSMQLPYSVVNSAYYSTRSTTTGLSLASPLSRLRIRSNSPRWVVLSNVGVRTTLT